MKPDAKTLADWVDRLLTRYPPDARLELRVAGCAIHVRSNSPELLDRLASDLHAFASADGGPPDVDVVLLEAPPPQLNAPFRAYPPAPGKQVIKDEYAELPDGRALRKRLTGMLFLLGRGGSLAVGPCLANRNQVINFVNNRYIQWRIDRGYLLCHAAGVTAEAGGLALAGISGAGKSTLALHLMSRGLHYVSNDRLLIGRDELGLHMHGVPKAPRINPGTILHNPDLLHMLTPAEREHLQGLPADALWRLEQKHDVDVETCFGPNRVCLTAPLRGVVMMTWRRDGGPTTCGPLDFDTHRALLQRLMKPVGVHYRVPPDHPAQDFSEQEYLALLGDCPVLGIHGGVDFDQAASACLDFLK